MRALTRLVVFLVSALMFFSAHAEDWPRFRGPNGQGVSSEVDLPIKWSDTDNVAWKTGIPGTAWSSPIVYGAHVFLTTATEEGVSWYWKRKKD